MVSSCTSYLRLSRTFYLDVATVVTSKHDCVNNNIALSQPAIIISFQNAFPGRWQFIGCIQSMVSSLLFNPSKGRQEFIQSAAHRLGCHKALRCVSPCIADRFNRTRTSLHTTQNPFLIEAIWKCNKWKNATYSLYSCMITYLCIYSFISWAYWVVKVSLCFQDPACTWLTPPVYTSWMLTCAQICTSTGMRHKMAKIIVRALCHKNEVTQHFRSVPLTWYRWTW